jgi:hypothetical protein
MTSANNVGGRLRRLLSDVVGQRIDVATFCDGFEHEYNTPGHKSQLDDQEDRIFRAVFKEIVWYSPFAEERAKIPNYIDEEMALAAARTALAELAKLDRARTAEAKSDREPVPPD